MTPVLTEDAIRRLPEPIVAKLRSLIARIRRVLWWRGCWLTLAALVASLIAVMAIDAAFDLESKLWRCLLSAAGLGAVAVVAWRTLFQPLRRTPIEQPEPIDALTRPSELACSRLDNILVVDDVLANRRLLEAQLRSDYYHVPLASGLAIKAYAATAGATA